MKSIVQHSRLGDIVVSQTMRTRRITISVRPPATVRLSVPYNMALCDAMAFVDQKAEWIEKHLERLRKSPISQIIEMPYATREHALRLLPDDIRRIRTTVSNGQILVSYPLEMHYSDPQVQSAAKSAIEAAWKLEALQILPGKLAEVAAKHGFKYGKVTINNTRSKWGSCSSRNDIQLSIHLMRLPNHLIDYVLLHELCHTIHKNHGEKFHALLDRLSGGNHRSLHKNLKEFHTRW